MSEDAIFEYTALGAVVATRGSVTYSGSEPPPPLPPPPPGHRDEGDVILLIDYVIGEIKLVPNNANIAGISIRSPSGSIVPDPDGSAEPFSFCLLNAPHEVTAGSVGKTTLLTEPVTLDITWCNLDTRVAIFWFYRFGETTPVSQGIIHILEPATLGVLVFGGRALLRRCRVSH